MSADALRVLTVAHDGPGHPYGDAAYCGGCLAEREADYLPLITQRLTKTITPKEN